MVRSRALLPGNPFRRATARVVFVFLLLAPLASDRLHNHDGAGEHLLRPAVTASPAARLGPAAGPSAPDRALPCPACLYHRTFSADPSGRAPEARQVAVSRVEPVPADPSPHATPTVIRTGPRAPPACS